MLAPRKILAIKLRSLGDTVLMTAPLLELRRAYPKTEIHVLTLTQWQTVLENHPAVSKVLGYERHKDMASRAKALARLAISLRQEKYDCVVNFHASPSSATLAFATGAPLRSIHFHGHRDRNRYSTVTVPDKGKLKPIIERDMDVVRALGLSIPPGRLPQIFLGAGEIDSASDYLLARKLCPPLMTIGLGASRPSKSWPIEKFAEAASLWRNKTGGSVLAVASAAERELAGQFITLSGGSPPIQVATDLPVRKLAAVLSRASIFLGNDSGPKHISVAAGVPTVTLFGPEHPFEWHPYPQDQHPYFFIESLHCRRDADPGMPSWCGIDVCVQEKHRCMKDIAVKEVFEQCLKVAKK